MAGIDPQRKALIDVLNQKEQERLAKQPPPSPLSQALASVAQPFQSYFDRQGKLAREGWDQANMGAEQLRAGDLPMGAANALLGPVNWLTSGINALLPEEQATRDFGRSLGGSTGETLAASGLGLAAIAMPGPDVGKGAKFADEAAEGITAYHGSPHTFDKFSMDKIGTGEGAQAYGHGLYFAENEGVAKSYKEALGKNPDMTHTTDGVKLNSSLQNMIDDAYTDLRGSSHGVSRQGIVDSVSAKLDQQMKDASRANDFEWFNRAADLRSELHRNAKTLPVDPQGSMYQVRLNVKPDELLDWDRPLSEQPESVRDALKASGAVGPKQSDWSMSGGKVLENMKTDPTFAADMRASGVKGIRYKDAGSRSAEGGTYNYVIFDDKLVSILKRYAIPFTLGAGGAAIVSGANMPPELAAQMGPEA